MTFVEECKAAAGPVWERWMHHPWTQELFAGTLSDEQFRYWLIQDLPYLGQHITEPMYPKVPPTSESRRDARPADAHSRRGVARDLPELAGENRSPDCAQPNYVAELSTAFR